MGAEESVPQPVRAPDAADLAEITALPQDENLLYTRLGKQCCWKDAGEYAWRIRQLEIINYAIQVLSYELYRKPLRDVTDVKTIIEKATNYRTVFGEPSEEHDWGLVSNDTQLFYDNRINTTQFKKFEKHLEDNRGASIEKHYSDLENYLNIFVALRNALIKRMASDCSD